MASNTPKLNLYKKNPLTDGSDTFNVATMLNENWDKIDAKFDETTGHNHTGAAGDGPKITSSGLANGAATDTVIGNRTISDSTAPTGDTAVPATLLGWLAYMVKAITGKSSWRTAPAKTLEDLNSHIGSGGGAHANVVASGVAGFMSGSDKAKLDGIAAGAQVNTVTSVAGKTGTVTLVKGDVGLGNLDNVQQAPLTHVGASGVAHAAATTSTAGFMSASDKTKLDGIAAGANNYVHPATHPPSIIAQDASNRFVTDTEKSTWNNIRADNTKTLIAEVRTSDPSSPAIGQIWFRSDL